MTLARLDEPIHKGSAQAEPLLWWAYTACGRSHPGSWSAHGLPQLCGYDRPG